jgi:hypothetical protein
MTSSGSSTPTLTLLINAIDSNEHYNRFFPSLTQPIFLSGDSISGQIRIAFPPSQTPPNVRDVSVQLIRKSLTQESILERCLIREFKSELGKTDCSLDFVFDRPEILYPSYHGTKCSVIYQLCAELKGRWRSKPVQKVDTIVMLEPIEQIESSPIEISVNVPSVLFSLKLDNVQVFSDDQISGKIVILKPQPTLEKVFLRLVVTEKWVDGMQSKSDERELLMYELVDGSPLPSPGIPFVIRIGKFHLWTYPIRSLNKVHVSYRLDVMVVVNHIMKVGAKQEITIVQRKL